MYNVISNVLILYLIMLGVIVIYKSVKKRDRGQLVIGLLALCAGLYALSIVR